MTPPSAFAKLRQRIAFRLLGLQRKENPAYRAILTNGLQGPIWTGNNYEQIAKEGYVQCIDAYACINILSDAVKGIPWVVYSKKSKSLTQIEQGPLVDLLGRANPREGGSTFMEKVTAFYKLTGNSYILRVGPENKSPKELYALRPDRMKIVQGTPVNPILGYEYKTGGVTVPMMPDKLGQTVLHFKSFHPTDDWYGLGSVQAASRAVDTSNAAQTWNAALLQNFCKTSGAMVVEGELADDQYDRLRDQLDRQYSGPQNPGRPWLLESGVKWQQMGLSPAEMDWLDGDERCTRKICSALGVPPELLGLMSKGGMNDSNFTQARKRLYLETVLPLMDFFKSEFNLWLTPLFGDNIFVDYDRDEIEAIQEDRQIVWDRSIHAVQAGILTPNEAREAVGYEALPGGDNLLVPIAVAAVGQVPVPPAKPGTALPEAAPPKMLRLRGGQRKARRIAPSLEAETPAPLLNGHDTSFESFRENIRGLLQ